MIDHVLDCHNTKIQSNISKHEWKAINYIKAIPELIVGKADEGNGIMFEDEKQYIQKEQDQMDICDVEPAKKPEHILLKNMRRRIIDCFNDMGVPWEEYRKFLSLEKGFQG